MSFPRTQRAETERRAWKSPTSSRNDRQFGFNQAHFGRGSYKGREKIKYHLCEWIKIRLAKVVKQDTNIPFINESYDAHVFFFFFENHFRDTELRKWVSTLSNTDDTIHLTFSVTNYLTEFTFKQKGQGSDYFIWPNASRSFWNPSAPLIIQNQERSCVWQVVHSLAAWIGLQIKQLNISHQMWQLLKTKSLVTINKWFYYSDSCKEFFVLFSLFTATLKHLLIISWSAYPNIPGLFPTS